MVNDAFQTRQILPYPAGNAGSEKDVIGLKRRQVNDFIE
jgi:hypothetical protein